jgi:ribonuclease D
MATSLDLDPGVLCSRERMDAVARRMPRHVDDLAEIPELRRWQAEVLGAGFVKALASGAQGAASSAAKGGATTKASGPAQDSPYRGE